MNFSKLGNNHGKTAPFLRDKSLGEKGIVGMVNPRFPRVLYEATVMTIPCPVTHTMYIHTVGMYMCLIL